VSSEINIENECGREALAESLTTTRSYNPIEKPMIQTLQTFEVINILDQTTYLTAVVTT